MDSDEWELHRPTIMRLYLEEGYTIDRVATYMKETHGFVKKKSQFEYKFKKWGVRKNARRDEWQYLRRQMQKREGRISEVTIRGRVIPEHKIRKELQRYTAIPTAREFQAGLPSPKTPEGDIIRVFKEQVPFKAVSTTIANLVKSIPEIGNGEGIKTQQLCNAGDMNSMATQLLVVLLFRLSNKFYESSIHDEKALASHDSFVMELVEEISKSNSAFLRDLLRSRSHTSDAIKEAVYASAVRASRYEFVSQLLKAGVDPNLPVHMFIDQNFEIERGRASIRWRHVESEPSGLEIAAYRLDTRLAEMLLEAGAPIHRASALLLDLVAVGDNHDRTVEIAQLLVHAGTKVDFLYTRDRRWTYLSPLAVAIARNNNRLARFFIENGADTDIYRRSCSFHTKSRENWLERRRYVGGWRSDYLDALRAGYTVLQIAIVAGNITMTDQLLRPILTGSSLPPRKVLKDTFLTACLAGDLQTAEKLLGLGIELNEGWELGITPFVATAWNPDIKLAESLLRLGARVDPLNQKLASFSRSPSALHVAAFYGNTALVQLLLCSGADQNLRFTPLEGEKFLFKWLLPCDHTSPFQFALESGDPATAAILYPQAELLAGELAQAVTMENGKLVSDLLSRAPDTLSSTVLEAAATSGDMRVITSFFSSGGGYQSRALFKAVGAAIQSKDTSIVELLSARRSLGPIEDYEASSLFNSIEKREWHLVHLLLQDPFLPGLEMKHEIYSFEDEGHPVRTTVLMAAIKSNNMSVIKEMFRLGYRPDFLDLRMVISYEPTTDRIRSNVASLIWSGFAPSSMDLTERQELLDTAIRLGLLQRVREWIPLVYPLDFYVYGRTPLQRAAEEDDIVLVRLLIHAGAKVNAPAYHHRGVTALQAAAALGNIEVAALLIQEKADVNAPAAKLEGRTALEAAAEHGRLDTVHFLLESGANLEGPMRIHYVRAASFAIREGHFAVAKYLKERGAWTDRDRELHNTAGVLDYRCHFVYNEETQDWKIRRMKYVKDDDDWYSVAYSDIYTDSDSYSESSDGTAEDANSSSQTENEIQSTVGFMDEMMENYFDLEAFRGDMLDGDHAAMSRSTINWIMGVPASAEEPDREEHSAQWGPMLTEGGEGFPETFDEDDFWNIR
ncbi:hypothetical protein DL768_004412 [Monosporascus sp. mg162]|nr:hypothetical protein DL768_004412 [Monosporascus sp. mg162]